MDDFRDLGEFSNVCRLFPLPQVVLFPHAVLSLHIFEPRYRQMTEDALAAGDKLVTIVQLCAAGSAHGLGSPRIEEVACIGKILQHRRLPDGRFNYLLLGLKRVRLTRELPSDRLYRLAEAEILEDAGPDDTGELRREELVTQFRCLLKAEQKREPELRDLLDAKLPLGVLTDLMAHALDIPADVKQGLLAEVHVNRRVSQLSSLLAQLLQHGPEPRSESMFPPPFSAN